MQYKFFITCVFCKYFFFISGLAFDFLDKWLRQYNFQFYKVCYFFPFSVDFHVMLEIKARGLHTKKPQPCRFSPLILKVSYFEFVFGQLGVPLV